VLFPITRVDGLLDWTTATDDEEETVGVFGSPEPVGELLGPIAINDVDLILVPAASVDASGMRLGWGRGYYDKTLGSMERCPPVYGVIFDSELVDEVPRERHDQAIDGVVTPTRTVEFSTRSARRRRI
jgi:5-formyltetrahydrofolate cyclo-ligase